MVLEMFSDCRIDLCVDVLIRQSSINLEAVNIELVPILYRNTKTDIELTIFFPLTKTSVKIYWSCLVTTMDFR